MGPNLKAVTSRKVQFIVVHKFCLVDTKSHLMTNETLNAGDTSRILRKGRWEKGGWPVGVRPYEKSGGVAHQEILKMWIVTDDCISGIFNFP